MGGKISQTKMEKYAYESDLSYGEYGNVVKAMFNNKLYAIKMIKIKNFEAIRPARQEVFAIQQLRCENIVKIYETYVWQDHFCIVMEQCQNSLEEVYRSFSKPLKNKVCREIVKGLNYMHKRCIKHGDIKLENILIKNGQPKIAGFGSSYRLATRNSKNLSRKGTLCYKPPEATMDDGCSFQMDCWAVGMVLLEIWTQKRVHQLRSDSVFPAQAVDFPSETDLKFIKNPKIKQAVRRLLQRDPSKRATMSEITQLLEADQICGSLYSDISAQLNQADRDIKYLKVIQRQSPNLDNMIMLRYPLHQRKIMGYVGVEEFAKQLQKLRNLREITLQFKYVSGYCSHSLNENTDFDCLIDALNSLDKLKRIRIIAHQNSCNVVNKTNNWTKGLRPDIGCEVE